LMEQVYVKGGRYTTRGMRREEKTTDCRREMRKGTGVRISGWDYEGPVFFFFFFFVFCFVGRNFVYKEE
jgi:hypothetical protein